MKKMNIEGDEIRDENVIQPTDKQGRLRGLAIENHENISV
jgi:hypothetical protein